MAMQAAPDPRARWQDAMLAARLAAACGRSLGGIHVQAGSGPVRDLWLEAFSALAGTRPVLPLPANIANDRLCGGIDLQATLAGGRLVEDKGILARASGGALIAMGAERLDATASAAICRALDDGVVESTASGRMAPACVTCVALDEATSDEPGLGAALSGRLAIRLQLDDISWSAIRNEACLIAAEPEVDCAMIDISDSLLVTLIKALGDESPRRVTLTVSLSKAIAALERRSAVNLRDVLTAMRLSGLEASRQPEEELPEEASPPPPPEPPSPENSDPQDAKNTQELQPPDQIDVAAALADIQGIALDVRSTASSARLPGAHGRSGEKRKKARRGRVTGLFERPPFAEARPDIAATLRAAVPWQAIRRAQRARDGLADTGRIILKTSDFRFRHYQDKRETAIIFAVDASGSTAFDRLGEAKGAIELLLADCYAQRHHVGLVSFRGPGAETLLQPTRSLVRAKRCLEALPGGGGTPLAAGVRRATELAAAARAKGQTPLMVFLSDGSGNIALDGTPGRAKASEDATATARLAASLSLKSLFIDIGRRGQSRGQVIADALRADYVTLPFASSRVMSSLVQTRVQALTSGRERR
jgi:magnesium chelatase subunit D